MAAKAAGTASFNETALRGTLQTITYQAQAIAPQAGSRASSTP